MELRFTNYPGYGVIKAVQLRAEFTDKGFDRLTVKLANQQIAEFVCDRFFLGFQLYDTEDEARFTAFQQAVTQAESALTQSFIRDAFKLESDRHNVFAAGFHALHERFFTAEIFIFVVRVLHMLDIDAANGASGMGNGQHVTVSIKGSKGIALVFQPLGDLLLAQSFTIDLQQRTEWRSFFQADPCNIVSMSRFIQRADIEYGAR